MAKGFKHGAGGANPLNFKVVGNPQPANPKENTIWVDTDVDITSYVFSATEPETPKAGMLWVKISDSSNIKVGTPLGKDYITIMLNSVSQYVGGAWVDKVAKSYQGGEWVDWVTYLYNLGDQCDSITGGWKAVNANGKMTFNDDHIAFTYSGSSDTHATVYTNNKIDLTGKTKLIAEVDVTSCNGVPTDLIVALYDTNTAAKGTHIACAGTTVTGNGQVLALNISAYQSEYYVGFRASSAVGEIYNIRLK